MSKNTKKAAVVWSKALLSAAEEVTAANAKYTTTTTAVVAVVIARGKAVEHAETLRSRAKSAPTAKELQERCGIPAASWTRALRVGKAIKASKGKISLEARKSESALFAWAKEVIPATRKGGDHGRVPTANAVRKAAAAFQGMLERYGKGGGDIGDLADTLAETVGVILAVAERGKLPLSAAVRKVIAA